MRTSEKYATITDALVKVQHAIEPVHKNKTVKVEGDRAKWESSYATLATLDAAVRPALKAEGIAVFQTTSHAQGAGAVLVTRLAKGDEWIEGEYPIKPSRDGAQGFGGGISFARRWCLCGLLNLVPDDVEEGQGYRDAAREGKAPRRAAAPTGIGGMLAAIRDAADCDAMIGAASKARAAHPTGEASAAVERTIETWFVDACERAQGVDDLTAIRDAANKVKPRGTDVRSAIGKAGARLEPR